MTKWTLETLREEIGTHMSGSRLSHTLAVEEETAHLCAVFALDETIVQRMRYAALLHDITKEIDTDGQVALCRKYGIACDETDLLAPKVLHAMTGAAVAADRYASVADDMVCDAIRYHTTGRAAMTLTEKILYLADYIEPTRQYSDCRALRREFYDALPDASAGRITHLNDILLASFDMTITHLLQSGTVISPRTIAARNGLLADRAKSTCQIKKGDLQNL